MPRAIAAPPPLPRAGLRIAVPLAAGAGAILAATTARLLLEGPLPAPDCNLLRWTGIPCPGCGATRCLAACGRLDFAAAFAWNPLVAFTALGLLAWSALAFTSPRIADQVPAWFSGKRVAFLVALNWLWLCWALPR